MDNKNESKSLRFLYKTSVGRAVLKVLTCRGVSKLCGAFLDSRASKFLIKGFVKKNKILVPIILNNLVFFNFLLLLNRILKQYLSSQKKKKNVLGFFKIFIFLNPFVNI